MLFTIIDMIYSVLLHWTLFSSFDFRQQRSFIHLLSNHSFELRQLKLLIHCHLYAIQNYLDNSITALYRFPIVPIVPKHENLNGSYLLRSRAKRYGGNAYHTTLMKKLCDRLYTFQLWSHTRLNSSAMRPFQCKYKSTLTTAYNCSQQTNNTIPTTISVQHIHIHNLTKHRMLCVICLYGYVVCDMFMV